MPKHKNSHNGNETPSKEKKRDYINSPFDALRELEIAHLTDGDQQSVPPQTNIAPITATSVCPPSRGGGRGEDNRVKKDNRNEPRTSTNHEIRRSRGLRKDKDFGRYSDSD